MAKHGESSDACFNPVPSQYPRKLYDDQSKKDWKPELRMDLYGTLVSDVHGATRKRSEVDNGDVPKTAFGLLIERVRNEHRVEKLLQSPQAGLIWDAVMDEDAGCTEDEELALRLFIVTDGNGKVVIDENRSRWPKHQPYAEVARQLYFIDPVKFRARSGDVPSREVTKTLILDGFAKKHLAFLLKYDAETWTYKQVRENAMYFLGEPWKRVPHRKTKQ